MRLYTTLIVYTYVYGIVHVCNVYNATLDQTRTQSLFVSLGEREKRLDSIEALGVTWEGAKEK